jgi:vitamin B12 transporter
MNRHALRTATALGLGGALGIAPAIALGAAAAARDTTETIIVWGERLEETLPLQLADYGSRVEVIGVEQIEAGNFVDVSAVLQNLAPGLYLTPKNGAFDYVNLSLQGSRSVDVVWLIDGVRINNRLYATTTPLDTIPAHMIERIEILKGGQSLNYGTQAVAGAINIVTRNFSEETDGQVSVGFDSNEGTSVSGYARGAFGPHRLVVFASADDSDGFQPFRDEDYQPSGTDRDRGYDVVNLGLKYGIDFSDDLIVRFLYQHTDATLDFARAYLSANEFNERDEDLVSAKVDWEVNDRLALYVKAYYHWWDTHYTWQVNDLDDDGNLTGTQSYFSNQAFWGFEDYGVNLLSEFEVNDALTVLAGYDFQSYSGEDEEFLIDETSEDVHAVFLQGRLDLDVLAGARISAGVRHNAPTDSQNITVWNLSGELDLNDTFYVRGQVGTSMRLPSAYELYVIDPCCEQGNPNLVGEESFNVEAGVGANYGTVSWEAIAFHRTIENLIDIDFDNPAFPDGVLANFSDEVEVNGAELIINAALPADFGLTFDYTHTDSTSNGDGPQLIDIPVDAAKLILDWRPAGRPFGASAAANWVGDLSDARSVGVSGMRSTERIEHGNYATLDLAGFVYLDQNERHRLGVRLENALDEEYFTQFLNTDVDGTDPTLRVAQGNLGAPRTLYVRYTLDF